jgi:uncharacterized repeat protein (TIGR04052 family)
MSANGGLGTLLLAACAGMVTLLGCGSADKRQAPTLTLELEARFGAEPMDCGSTFAGLGSTEVTAKPLDFRFYLHDVALVRAGGKQVAFELENDGVWQRDGVALLDFEDGSGSCETGSAETNTSLRGSAPEHDDYVGVAFTLGVPERLNHLDAATALAPFNTPGLWWSWQGGYRYMRLDVATDDHPGGYFFHLGGTNCSGTPAAGFTCQYANLARVTLAASALGPIVIDAQALYSELDLSQQPDGKTDLVPGCMASPGDPECAAMFGALGLAFEASRQKPPKQAVFRLQ